MANVSVDKLRKMVEARIGNDSITLRIALNVCEIEKRKDQFIIRLPDAPIFDELYVLISELCDELKITHKRTGKLFTVAELDDVLGNIKWLWESWLPIGFVTLLVGEPGDGKSMLALDLVRCVTDQVNWPLGTQALPAPSNAVWVETESSQQLIKVRTISMGMTRNRIVLPGFGNDLLGQPDLMRSEDQQKLINVIATCRPALVVVDSLGGAHTHGENRIEEVRPMLDFLARLSRDYGVGMIAIHHLRKRAATDSLLGAMDRIRGSNAFSAFARSIIGIEKMVSTGTIKMSVIKTNLCRPPLPVTAQIVFNKDGNPTGIQYEKFTPPERKRTKKEKCADWVHSLLKARAEDGAILFTEIQDAANAEGYTRGMLYDARDVLGDSLVITGTGRRVSWELIGNPFATIGANGNGEHGND